MSHFRRQCLQTSLVDCSGTCFPQLAQHSRVGFRAACHQYSWSVGSAMAWDGDDSILGFSGNAVRGSVVEAIQTWRFIGFPHYKKLVKLPGFS